MSQSKRRAWIAVAVVLAVVQFASILLLQAWLYTTVQLAIAKAMGIYATPEDGIRARCASNRDVQVTRIEIEHAGIARHDGSHPYIWYVIARFWAERRPDGEPTHLGGYYSPRSCFIRGHEGWVRVPEGRLPYLIGACMQVFGLA